MEVRYVDWGLANNFGTHIELNRNLLKYPKLHDSILEHEMSHTDKVFTMQDLRQDLSIDRYEDSRFRFIMRYPKSLTQFLPIYWSMSKGLVYDVNMIIIYSFFILLLVLVSLIGSYI